MGVERSDAILVGVNIGMEYYNSDEWDKDDSDYEKYSLSKKSEPGDLVYIIDGMNGDYFIVGELIKVDYHGYNGLGTYIFNEKNEIVKRAKNRVWRFIFEKFGLDTTPKLMVTSHFH